MSSGTSAFIEYLSERAIDVVEADADAEAAWVDHVNEVYEQTLYPLANSWYLGANIPGKPRVFMPYAGGVGRTARSATRWRPRLRGIRPGCWEPGSGRARAVICAVI